MTRNLIAGRLVALVILALGLGLALPKPALAALPRVCWAEDIGPVCYTCAELLKHGEWMVWLAACAPF